MKRTFSGLLLILFLIGTITLAFNLGFVSAQGKTVYVKADESFSPFSVREVGLRPCVASSPAAVRSGALMGPDALPIVNYDEQLGLCFGQNFTTLTYNVTAVQQNDTYGYGPAYLLNGVTDQGYWYQVGLSYDWPNTDGTYAAGFNFNYEVFNNSGDSIFPVDGGGGLDSFNGTVYAGDNVLLNLYLSNGNVTMYAYDWNTNASAEETYPAAGASLFIGAIGQPGEGTVTYFDENGFFTGLMTEWWHPNRYYGGEAQVVYDEQDFALPMGYLWADEWKPPNGPGLFSDGQQVVFSDPTQLQSFTTNGAAEAASGYLFITGVSVSVSPSSATMDVGQQQLFDSSVIGGTSPYAYQWYLNGSAILGATGSTLTFAPSSSGSYTVCVNVTDDDGFTAESNNASVTVNPSPSVSVSPGSITIDIGQFQLFTATVSGGVSPYTYQWYLDANAVSGATNATWTFAPASLGSYTVYVDVTDSLGAQATSNNVNVTVYTHDVAVTSVSSSKTVVGQGFGLNVSVTVADLGNYTETFNVTVYANTIYVTSENVTLQSGAYANVTLTWNSTGFAYGNYTISAYAWPVPGETNTANNNCTGGWVLVSIVGDVNGDGQVNMKDIALVARAFSSVGPNYLYAGSPPSSNWNPNADILNDGTVNMRDIALVARNFGNHYP